MPAPRREPRTAANPSVGSPASDPLAQHLGTEDATPNQVLAAVVHSVERARPDWHRDALCREPEYSNIDFTGPSAGMQAKAIQVCGQCQVRTECLAWALEIGDEAAVLGGMTPSARRAHQRAADARNRKRGAS